MKKFNQFLLATVLTLFSTVAFAQGVTTAAINGQITEANGSPLPGASIVAVHTPSGTTYGVATDFDGYYRISNMRTGGPYSISITYVGFQEYKDENVFLSLGESKRISVELSEDASVLDEVIITAQTSSVFDAGKTGAETRVSQRQVNTLPSLSRNIADFARLTPQAKVTGDDVISIAGQNNRYNAIFIDGAVNNDVFGLAGSGTNGGQTGVSPISLDAIESFQVNVAPFDVRQSGFAGGSINAITKSGTNTWTGSAYTFLRNQDLAGKTPIGLVDDEDDREKLDEFSANIYGVRLGGPIIENKLFFFINYEREERETPAPFNFDAYLGDSSEADITNLSNTLQNTFNYNPGGFENSLSSLISDKLIAKIDWNINDNNTLSFKHSYVKAQQTNAGSSSQRNINFFNSGLGFESITNSSALELSSRFGNKYANNLVIGYTTVDDDRDPLGNPFPRVNIRDGAGSINFGSEPFSTANLLEQRTLTLTNNFEIYSGKHTITIGTNNEFSSMKNVFFRQNFGDYRFNSLSDFVNGELPNRFRLGYSLVGGTGDESLGAPEFDFFQTAFYIQDEVNINENFKLTAGIRFDIPFWADGPVNEEFNTLTVARLEAAGKDLQGARVGKGVDANVHISPRIGFNYDVNGEKKTQIRGGLGIFTSRVPLVWPGGTYGNNGVTTGFVQRTNADAPAFNPNPNTQLQGVPDAAQPGTGEVGGQVDLFAPDFMLPQVFKANIAIDQKLPGGFVFSADFIWNDNISAVIYENINLVGPQFSTTGAGSRPNYGFEKVDDTYSDIFLGTNTSAGSSFNVSGTLSKNVITERIDIRTSATYSYGESNGILDGTSSQNSSQWESLETVNGSNRPDLSISDFDPGHRVLLNSTIEFKWSETTKTRIGLFYEGAEGAPLSYVYDGQGLLSDTGRDSALIFVPANQADANLVDTGDLTAGEQWALLDSFIEGNDYLSTRRGKFAERNADRSNWTHIIDLKFAQEFGLKFGDKIHRIEFTADIFNFTNLINKEWGVRTFAGRNQVQLLDIEGFASDGTTPEFSYNPNNSETGNIISDRGLNSSRWQMQVGLRYTF